MSRAILTGAAKKKQRITFDYDSDRHDGDEEDTPRGLIRTNLSSETNPEGFLIDLKEKFQTSIPKIDKEYNFKTLTNDKIIKNVANLNNCAKTQKLLTN